MMDYTDYCAFAGVTNAEVVRALRGKFPRFSKIQTTMISHPENYGVCLLPEAEAELIAVYGPGPQSAAARPRPPKRRKPRRLVVYLSEEDYARFRSCLSASGCATIQEYLREMILMALANEELGMKNDE